MRAHTISPPTAACSAARAPSLESDWQQFFHAKEYPRRLLPSLHLQHEESSPCSPAYPDDVKPGPI